MKKEEEIEDNKYVLRLFKEWVAHGKIIIGVDFDSTISYYNTLENHDDIAKCLKLLRVAQATGCYTVIHTACNPDRHKEIKKYCEGVGLKIDTINKTPLENFPYGKEGSKPYCNIFLDDRAGFLESMEILEQALYKYRGYLESNRIQKLGDVA